MFTADTLKGRSVLVTGGASGLGLAMATRCRELGADVAICGRNQARLDAALHELTKIGPAYAVQCDVRDHDRVNEMFDRLWNDMGKVDALINNAAGNFLCPSEELSPNGFRTVVDIVLHGSFNCSQHFGRRLIDAQLPGALLNIVTTYTEIGSAFMLPSACAKAGVYALTTTLAAEWASYGIRSNAIAPGPIPTEGAWARLVPDAHFEAEMLRRVPLKRFGTREELANLAVFLLSGLGSYITGECVTMDGGERLSGGEFNFLTELLPREELKEKLASMRPQKGSS
jgi:NAD(P)-dependent dehydrogenase (short-subunit alcohol dehydrogenase family)